MQPKHILSQLCRRAPARRLQTALPGKRIWADEPGKLLTTLLVVGPGRLYRYGVDTAKESGSRAPDGSLLDIQSL